MATLSPRFWLRPCLVLMFSYVLVSLSVETTLDGELYDYLS